MEIYHSIVLGCVQGLTEFLPISSSGHLVIIQSYIPSFHQPGLLFDVVLHAGTLLAVVVYYWKVLPKLSIKYIYALVVASIPAVIVGVFLNGHIKGLFENTFFVGIALIVTALINYLTDSKSFKPKHLRQGWTLSVAVGVAQAFAIIPGISRSGSTIFTGSKLGLTKKKAAEFSFLLSIPAILGANVMEISKLNSYNDINITAYFMGFLSAFIVGYVSIKVVLVTLINSKFKFFALYCLLLGVFVLSVS
jgi:undecaprenyl-diphosphatase